jgi:hypothetical protein
VPTPTAKTTTENITQLKTELPAFARKAREQLVSTVQQSQQLSVDAAQTWVKVVSVLPIVNLPKVPGLPVMPDVEAATKYSFDVAGDLLSAQRDFALQLTKAFVPAKTS